MYDFLLIFIVRLSCPNAGIAVPLAAVNRTLALATLRVGEVGGHKETWEPVSNRQRLRDLSSLIKPNWAGRKLLFVTAALGDRPKHFPTAVLCPPVSPPHPGLPRPGRPELELSLAGVVRPSGNRPEHISLLRPLTFCGTHRDGVRLSDPMRGNRVDVCRVLPWATMWPVDPKLPKPQQLHLETSRLSKLDPLPRQLHQTSHRGLTKSLSRLMEADNAQISSSGSHPQKHLTLIVSVQNQTPTDARHPHLSLPTGRRSSGPMEARTSCRAPGVVPRTGGLLSDFLGKSRVSSGLRNWTLTAHTSTLLLSAIPQIEVRFG